MKTANIAELKATMASMPANQLALLCIRLARFKKENKELLTYLLFDANDELLFIKDVKMYMQEEFEQINFSNLYYVKKSLRKILRVMNKHIRYSGLAETEVILLMFFCRAIKERVPIEKNTVIKNLFNNQLKKLEKCIASLHEDLQYEYLKELQTIN